MSVLFLSPGFPAEMPLFTRGLAEVGQKVVGCGDQPQGALPETARRALSAYIQIPSFADEAGVVREVLAAAPRYGIDRVESLWEPVMILAARLRQALGLPGMTVEQTVPFRDKELMKQVLDRAGIRTPRHARCRTENECREAAEMVGYPLIIKPIAGAGSADTWRVEGPADLEAILRRVAHVPEVSVEEFIEADEFTFDTVCAGGAILYHNICWYNPRPLISRQNEWISPQTYALREVDRPDLESGRRMGRAVLEAMGFRDGFTHMEWYRKADGEAVFGEIGARPPGARTVDVMNFACDLDLFRGWAEAVSHGRISQPITRKYTAVSVFKRARGQGRIQGIEGLGRLMAEYGESIVTVDLLPVGAQRRDWLQTLISDGMVIARHSDFATIRRIADRIGSELQLHAA